MSADHHCPHILLYWVKIARPLYTALLNDQLTAALRRIRHWGRNFSAKELHPEEQRTGGHKPAASHAAGCRSFHKGGSEQPISVCTTSCKSHIYIICAYTVMCVGERERARLSSVLC